MSVRLFVEGGTIDLELEGTIVNLLVQGLKPGTDGYSEDHRMPPVEVGIAYHEWYAMRAYIDAFFNQPEE